MQLKSNHVEEMKYFELDGKAVTAEGEFEGYGSKFGVRDQGGDIVEKGAFSATLSSRDLTDIKMLWQHDPSEPIGVWTSMKEDSKGLKVSGKLLLGLAKAKETLELMRAGVVKGLSIGYRTIKASNDPKSGARILKELDLWEVSLVTFPMLPQAQVTAVKGDWTIRDAERVLRDAGMPNAMAKKLLAGGWDNANTRARDEGHSDIAAKLAAMTASLTGSNK